MKARSICVLHGHPDASTSHFCDALGDAYAEGARAAGHSVSEIRIAELDFDFLRTSAEFETPPPHDIALEREKIAAADHVVMIFPLWLGGMPAICRAFMEQCARAGFMLDDQSDGQAIPRRMMKGKSARLVVTMGMPGIVYRLMFGAHGVRVVERSIFGISGFKPIRRTLLGGVGAASDEKRRLWLDDMREKGARAR